MQLITRQSVLWKSLSDDTRDLINTGETVLQFVYDYKDRTGIVDYSFCVFSFAKAYEGYLKSLFLKMGFISEHDYYGDDIRIGRILSPYFAESKENIFYKICNHPNGGSDLSNTLWEAWRQSRNLVFHYYPHNFRKLNYDEAFKAITKLVDAMNFAANRCAQVEKGLLSKKEIQKNNEKQKSKAIKKKRDKNRNVKLVVGDSDYSKAVLDSGDKDLGDYKADNKVQPLFENLKQDYNQLLTSLGNVVDSVAEKSNLGNVVDSVAENSTISEVLDSVSEKRHSEKRHLNKSTLDKSANIKINYKVNNYKNYNRNEKKTNSNNNNYDDNTLLNSDQLITSII